ncbi:unnamed protein product [Caenorhabditis bovis]|uniref:Uncharacterized protein n=1 Tax=Caenorhabditis bovis TaxID=2654633 RepID=A0A8S1ENL1_9PELO|nr:unnamed protein product [Caenorhabditis bovis]
MSHFARSDAVHYAVSPRKQVSSPLPDQSRRIYERGHAHSRSWNPGAQPSPPILVNQSAAFKFYEPKPEPRVYEVPIINEPPSPTPCRRVSVVPRQAKSFDERRALIAIEQRSQTLAERQLDEEALVKEEVSAACQSLWAAKGHLERLHALGVSEPSSVSTSFESNTDSQATGDTVDIETRSNAKGKRMQYRNLLLQRQFLSTAAVSSMESNVSTDESDPLFASSFDSTRSELERRRLSLMNATDYGNQEGPSATRDYSVDARSDSLFREWSRVDPAYDPYDTRKLQRGHTVDQTTHHQQSPRRFERQFSLATAPRPNLLAAYRNG